MATATVDSAAATDGGLIRLDSIPIVDLRLLSQSELYSLSRCSSSVSDPNKRDDVVVPVIDRSIFNESAGSRKQTYSRLRLAPSNSSSSAALRSRTPHLRSTGTAYGAINSKSDPVNAEDYQIINLVKQSFVADMDPGDLVPVKIEYSNSLPAQQFTSPPPSSPSNVGPMGVKRKRGRPRKNEFVGNVKELAVEVNVVDASDMDMLLHRSLNDIAVREDVEERDREVLNSDGVAVDLVALGAVEHPYWEGIRLRTEGLRTEEELLEFLKGLNGIWGSRRKKRRIVDADEFGSKLPVGWKLLLSVKKKNGHVWLYCRRYISPSGLHFVSCKGVSSYLLSLHGVHDTNPHISAQYNDNVDDADKLISVSVSVQGGVEMDNSVSRASSSPSDLATVNHEIQVPVNVGGLPADRIGESLCCNKCNITFSTKDKFLQHQSSLHRKNRHKNVVRITDGVIIKDGKYECQFCHKTFSERHRYNGHVGTHVRFQAKLAGESCQSVHPGSLNEVPVQDNVITNNGPNVCLPHNTDDDHFQDLEEDSANMRGNDKATDIVTESNPCSAAGVLFSHIENKSLHQDACMHDSGAEISDISSPLQGRRSESSLSCSGAAYSDMNASLIENSAALEKPKQIMVSKSCLLDCNDHVEECVQVNNNQNNNDDTSNQTENDLKLDSQKLVANGSVFDTFGTQGDEGKKLAVNIKEKSHMECFPCNDGATNESISTGSEAAKLDKGPTIDVQPIADDEKALREDNVSYPMVNNDGVNRHEDMQFGVASVLQSCDKQENASKRGDAEVFTHLSEVDMSKSQLVADGISMYHYENNDGGVCRREAEFGSLQNFGNSESSDLFSTRISSDFMTGIEHDTRLGICSPFTYTADKQLSAEDNMITVFNNTMEERRQETLLDKTGVSEVSNEAYKSNKIYNTPANPSVVENAGKHELSLSFGGLQTDMYADSNDRVEQESYQENSFNTFGDPNLSFNGRTHESGSSFNVAQREREWDETQGNKIATSNQNFMIGFGNNLQTSEYIAADGSWRTGQDNVYGSGGCLDAHSGPHISSSSFFPTFGIAPDKGQESSFGMNHKYGIQSDMMRPGRSQPVEYSFMGEQRVDSLPEPKIFPYDTNTEQGMDTSIWLAKDALTTNASQLTSVCVWCRNVFFHEPGQAGIQTGAIGTMCPSCSSRIPSQFNVL